MLVQYTPVSTLDAAARQRLIASAQSLLLTNEASRGHVMFEGRYFSTSEVRAAASSNKTFLAEG